MTTKPKKSKEISCFGVLDVLFSGLKAFSVAWAFFYGGQGISKLKYFIKKNMNFFQL
jgi:hypothetical protein